MLMISLVGVLALVTITLFAVYRKRTLLDYFGRRRNISSRPATGHDPETAMTRPSAQSGADDAGPLQRNPPNVADFFSFSIRAEHSPPRQRPVTPENLSTVMEEITSQRSHLCRNSQDSFPTPLVAQAAHMQPAATTNADNVPLLSFISSPPTVQRPESAAQRDSRYSLTARMSLAQAPDARDGVYRDRESLETIDGTRRFRTVESWVNSQAKRLNLPSAKQDSRT